MRIQEPLAPGDERGEFIDQHGRGRRGDDGIRRRVFAGDGKRAFLCIQHFRHAFEDQRHVRQGIGRRREG